MNLGTALPELPPPPDLLIDMNGDGVFTISDVWLWIGAINEWLPAFLKWAFFFPGNYGLKILMNIRAPSWPVHFFEITPESYDGWVSGIASSAAWFTCIGAATVFTIEFLDWLKDVFSWLKKLIENLR